MLHRANVAPEHPLVAITDGKGGGAFARTSFSIIFIPRKMSVKNWLSLSPRSQYRDTDDTKMPRERRPKAWKWPILASRRDSYDILCEECVGQPIKPRRCRHQDGEKAQAGYTNPME